MYLSFPWLDFFEVGARLDPEYLSSFYSRLRNLWLRMPLSWAGCSACPPRWLSEYISVAKYIYE